MQQFEYTEGTPVISSDGNELGTVERLVVRPRDKEISHLVLSKGLLFPEERVVPASFVATASSAVVTLHQDVELDDLPLFEETHFLELDGDSARRSFPTAVAAPLIWAYPAVGSAIPASTYSRYMASPQAMPEVRRNTPDGTVSVQIGAPIRTSDDEEVGTVTRVTTNDEGDLISVEVDPGWFKDSQTIPGHFVERIDEDTILLGLSATSLDRWRDHQEPSPS